jgi:hypothetical protein
VRALAVAGSAGAFLCLIGAAYLKEPAWRWALLGITISGSIALCATAGALAHRVTGGVRQALAPGLACGVAAALTRQVLLALVRSRAADAPPQIRPLTLFAATFTIVGGLAALLFGIAALRRLGGASEGTRLRRGIAFSAGGIAVALGLYGISPVWHSLGWRVNHWTFIGLAGLALCAYLIEEGVAWLAGSRPEANLAAEPDPAAEPPRARRRRRR